MSSVSFAKKVPENCSEKAIAMAKSMTEIEFNFDDNNLIIEHEVIYRGIFGNKHLVDVDFTSTKADGTSSYKISFDNDCKFKSIKFKRIRSGSVVLVE